MRLSVSVWFPGDSSESRVEAAGDTRQRATGVGENRALSSDNVGYSIGPADGVEDAAGDGGQGCKI